MCTTPAPTTKTRSVLFYKPTRSQAPRYAKVPALADKVECSICRGLFFLDDAATKAAHRAWHKTYGNAHMPCREAFAAGGVYEILATCRTCTEDYCLCADCFIQHSLECEQWVKAWNLAAIDEDAGEAAMMAILEARTA